MLIQIARRVLQGKVQTFKVAFGAKARQILIFLLFLEKHLDPKMLKVPEESYKILIFTGLLKRRLIIAVLVKCDLVKKSYFSN